MHWWTNYTRQENQGSNGHDLATMNEYEGSQGHDLATMNEHISRGSKGTNSQHQTERRVDMPLADSTSGYVRCPRGDEAGLVARSRSLGRWSCPSMAVKDPVWPARPNRTAPP